MARTIRMDIFVETQGLLDRIEDSARERLGPLNTELVRLQKLANLIGDIVAAFRELRTNQTRFLSGYIHLEQSITRIKLATISMPAARDPIPDELGEMKSRKERIGRLKDWSAHLD